MRTFHSAHSSVFAILGLAFVAGCGIENSLVGGQCADGMVMTEGGCVAKRPDVTLITPGDTESGNVQKSGTTPGTKALPLTNPDRISAPLTGETVAQPELPAVNPPATPVVDPPVPPGLVCAAPLVSCRGACISVETDPMNCGACNKICPSQICVAGECQGATPGDVVLIGHDYTNALDGTAQAKVLVNALTIPTTEPIRVLSYEDGATPEAVAQAKTVAGIDLKGRAIEFTRVANPSDLESSALAKSFDVVLIHGAGAGDVSALGTSWAASLGGFASKGGVVIALDNGSSPMPQLLTSSGLLTVSGHTTMPLGSQLSVVAAQDVIGAQVLSPYATFGFPVSFQGVTAPNDDLTWVVRSKNSSGGLADPVVIHRIVR